MPEAPVCTCIMRIVPTKYGDTPIIQVIDPYCQRRVHAAAGTYTGPEPTYGKAGNG